MGTKIAIVGAGAVGSYCGAHMVRAGADVTFIDPWPAHVEAMRTRGIRVSHAGPVDEFTQRVRALDVTEVQGLSKEAPIDIAFVCVKSYDTAWATMLIKPYLAPQGFVVSLQNCMNEETVAGVVGWGRTVGCIASRILVELRAPGDVHRGASKAGAGHTVFRAGEVHGRITSRVEEVCRLMAQADSAMTTQNLWGERWSKLVANSMYNGLSAATGLPSNRVVGTEATRRFAIRLGGEAIRVGQALGYALEDVFHIPPESIARASEGDRAALDEVEQRLIAGNKNVSDEQRPSMGQDVLKGRRTEIDFLNGYVVARAQEAGLPAAANAALVSIVRRVERGELKPDPRHISDVRLN